MDEEWTMIAGTLANPKYKWRTIEGIVKDTGLDYTTVVSSISAHEDLIIKSAIPSREGKDLYATREHYRKKRTPWQIISSSITNKVE